MTRRLVHVAGVVTQELDGQALLLAPDHAVALHLDEVATAVWQMLAHRPTWEELVAALSEVFEVPEQRISSDLGPVLSRLAEHGVLAEVEET